jgi:uncharacterized protein YraI
MGRLKTLLSRASCEAYWPKHVARPLLAGTQGTRAPRLIVPAHTERLTPACVPCTSTKQRTCCATRRWSTVMNRVTLGLGAGLAALVVAPTLASALSAVTTESTNLRAGPALDFPVVDQIPSDVRVNVHGCVRGYRWCDVSWRDARGWVPGEELAYLYQGQRVTIVEYGPRIGLPVIAFAFDTYWDRYYRSRSWYGERARWRTVWRERERDGRSTSDRTGDRREDRVEDRTESRRETSGRQRDESERRLDRRGDREGRPDGRTGRGDWRDRGETRGYVPQGNPTPRREIERGTRPGDANPAGRMGPSMRDRGSEGQGGRDRGGPGQSDRRP